MAIRYPNGKKYTPSHIVQPSKNVDYSYSNRGKTLEDELNESNMYYISRGMAIVHKKPIPIQVVNVHYPARSAAVITEAYYRTPSTTDFNGVWNGRYIDFEAKETKSATSFPLQNVHEHQVDHMKQVSLQNGLAFLIVKFTLLNRYFILPFEQLEPYWERMKKGGRKSITLNEFEQTGTELTSHINPVLDYLKGLHVAFRLHDEPLKGRKTDE